MPSFQVYTCKNDINVSLDASDPVKIDETTLACIRLFHHYVFKELQKLDNQLTALSETDGYLAVPLVANTQPPPSSSPTTVPNNSFQIHYEFLREFSTFFQATGDPNVKLNSSLPCEDFSCFQNKIVRRVNESANQTHYTRYFVAKVCQDLSPSSPFPDQDVATTFAEYYQKRYGIQVNLQQPLLLVQHLPTQVNFIVPRYRLPTDNGGSFRGTKVEIHLIPELCSVLPLSASAWSLARYLPAVVYRLEAILRAHEMKLKMLAGISRDGEDSCADAGRDGVSDGDARPSISLMLHALTAKSVGQQFHSEQLELLGDTFLKLEVSLELFLTDPEKDEWVLSIYRKHLVSNDMLSTQGRRLGIPGYISVAPPDLPNTSLPPGFILSPSQGVKEVPLNLYTHQVLGDKHVANSVEALIGATLVSCGRNVARHFLIWLGVTQYTSSELGVFYQHLQAQATGDHVNCVMSEERMNGEKEQQDPTPWKKDCGISLKNPTRPVPNFDHIERELGYCFKNKLLLLQALTHNSYPRFLSQVSETYQKMEFVGDAILDYLVTLYLYEHFPNLNHGDVTDFRSGLVNNFTLAFLAVKKNLHQSLRHMSPPLLDVIGQFLKFLEEQELIQGASWKVSFIFPRSVSIRVTDDCFRGKVSTSERNIPLSFERFENPCTFSMPCSRLLY